MFRMFKGEPGGEVSVWVSFTKRGYRYRNVVRAMRMTGGWWWEV